jgi:hypothetical protein
MAFGIIQQKVTLASAYIDLDQLPADTSILDVTIRNNSNTLAANWQPRFVATTWTRVRVTQIGNPGSDPGHGYLLEHWIGEGPFTQSTDPSHPFRIALNFGRTPPTCDSVAVEVGG